MKNYKKILSVVMTAAMAASLAACGNSTANTSSTTDAAASDAAQTSDAAATESGAGTSSDGKKYTIGICQQLEHPALDQATQGFEDALTELLGSGNVTFDLQNAQGEQANCATISNGFVANNYDLILANATTALQCAAAATSTIPVIGTSVTDYATALDIDNWTGSTGTNVSGTADLAPIDQQEDMLVELFPDAKNVGILYCSAEPNSAYQFILTFSIFPYICLPVLQSSCVPEGFFVLHLLFAQTCAMLKEKQGRRYAPCSLTTAKPAPCCSRRRALARRILQRKAAFVQVKPSSASASPARTGFCRLLLCTAHRMFPIFIVLMGFLLRKERIPSRAPFDIVLSISPDIFASNA